MTLRLFGYTKNPVLYPALPPVEKLSMKGADAGDEDECAFCKRLFIAPETVVRKVVYCSPTCRLEAARARRGHRSRQSTAVCKWCGDSFETSDERQKFCCANHRKLHWNRERDALRRASRVCDSGYANLPHNVGAPIDSIPPPSAVCDPLRGRDWDGGSP